MSTTPHLVQYQGSKRNIAPEIIKYIPSDTHRIIEPFAGTCAFSILAAKEKKAEVFILNDINEPLLRMMENCVEDPYSLYTAYNEVWTGQFAEGENNIDYFYKIRDQFNQGDQSAAKMLFLLARVVKGAVRYSTHGEMNQSCDKRRYGTKPETILINASRISALLKNRTTFYSKDYREILAIAKKGDLVYMDPPYQGTSNNENPRDNRYIQGVDYSEFVDALFDLNERNIDYIVSYDGMTGEHKIGLDLPEGLHLTHLFINAGVSAQSVLNGKKETTYESLYLSPNISSQEPSYQQLSLDLGGEVSEDSSRI